MDVVIHARTERVQILGSEEQALEAKAIIQVLQVLVNRGMQVALTDVVTAMNMSLLFWTKPRIQR